MERESQHQPSGHPPNVGELAEAILRRVDREIWVVTSRDGERRGGLLATWVMGVSIDPAAPAMLAGIAPNHFTSELIEGSRSFALHLLDENQHDLAFRFALGSGRSRDKLLGLASTTAVTGSPILLQSAAWLDCRMFARLATGDRTFFWGEIVAAGENSQLPILTESRLISAASAEQLAAMRADRQADIERQRPGRQQWRTALCEGREISPPRQ